MRRTVASLPQRTAPMIRPPEADALRPPRAQPAAAHLHPSGRPQPGLCADRLVDPRRTRPDHRDRRALALAANISRRGCSTGCARRKAPPIRRAHRHLSSASFPTGESSTPPPRSGPSGADTFFRARARDHRRPRRPAGRWPTSSAGAESGGERHRAAAGDQQLLARRAGGLDRASRGRSSMSAPISPTIAR